jgi:cytolysin-activating lysine-acyltransferase
MTKLIFADLMKAKVLSILDNPPNNYASQFTEQLGAAAILMMISERYKRYPVEILSNWIAPAVKAGQVKIYYAPEGRPLGYVIWAWMTDEAERRWIDDPRMLRYSPDWTDGENLWIVDFVISPGFERLLLGHIKANLFIDQPSVSILRRDKDDKARRVSMWLRHNDTWRLRSIS